MGNYFGCGARDANNKRSLYGSSLPHGTRANDQSRATYRAGWITQKVIDGEQNLPAWFMQLNSNFYWIVAIDNGKPIYNVTKGESPDNQSGYFSLDGLMALKGDKF